MNKNQIFTENTNLLQYDYIVIGSGIGGLTTATWLAKAGKKVAVLEKHYVPGGFTHAFKRKKGLKWDVGVHYVGNLDKNESLLRMFNFISENKLEWEFMGEVYDVVNIGDKTFEFKAGKENFRKQLISYFPEEEKAIHEYLALLEKVNKKSSLFFLEKIFEPWFSQSLGWILRNNFYKYSDKTTKEVLTELTQNKLLISVLCAQCGNYGLSPKYSSFTTHASVISHFMEGGYYPKGGSENISKTIIEELQRLGSQVFIKADVQQIITENNKVTGIKVNNSIYKCSNIISNAGVNNTFNHLLSEEDKKHCKIDFKEVKPAVGHLCLYVGLDRSAIDLNLPKHNVWNYAHENIDEVINETRISEVAEQFSYITFPSAKDSEWKETHPNQSTIQAISLGKYEWFSQVEHQPWMKREESYMKLKTEFEASMLEKLYQLFPQIKGHVVHSEVSTPLSTKHFSNYKNGEIYGLEHSSKRFRLPFLRPKTKIKGLYLTGQDIILVGVTGAMISGVLCAISILKMKSWKMFNQLKNYS